MTRTLSTLGVCLLAVVGIGRAQVAQQPTPPPPQDVTLFGCLTQGSQPSIFILEHARPTSGSNGETALRYLVLSDAKDVDLLSNVNREVELRGTVSGRVPPPEKQREEANLPTLRVRELTSNSTTCVSLAHGPQQIQQEQSRPDVTLTGCLATGESGAYLLSNAVAESGIVGTNLKFLVVADNDGINLKSHLNHQVRVMGPTDGKAPTSRPVPESELPTIRVKTISSVTNECVGPGRG